MPRPRHKLKLRLRLKLPESHNLRKANVKRPWLRKLPRRLNRIDLPRSKKMSVLLKKKRTLRPLPRSKQRKNFKLNSLLTLLVKLKSKPTVKKPNRNKRKRLRRLLLLSRSDKELLKSKRPSLSRKPKKQLPSKNVRLNLLWRRQRLKELSKSGPTPMLKSNQRRTT